MLDALGSLLDLLTLPARVAVSLAVGALASWLTWTQLPPGDLRYQLSGVALLGGFLVSMAVCYARAGRNLRPGR